MQFEREGKRGREGGREGEREGGREGITQWRRKMFLFRGALFKLMRAELA